MHTAVITYTHIHTQRIHMVIHAVKYYQHQSDVLPLLPAKVISSTKYKEKA